MAKIAVKREKNLQEFWLDMVEGLLIIAGCFYLF
jgi:hypothetical protein